MPSGYSRFVSSWMVSPLLLWVRQANMVSMLMALSTAALAGRGSIVRTMKTISADTRVLITAFILIPSVF